MDWSEKSIDSKFKKRPYSTKTKMCSGIHDMCSEKRALGTEWKRNRVRGRIYQISKDDIEKVE